MADGDRRVEPRIQMVGRGAGTTPERIEALQQRARQLDKLSRPKPARPFSEVLSDREHSVSASDSSDIESEKDKRYRSLPKKGPRPGLLHPAQRDSYGRENDPDKTVVLKG